MSKDTISVNMNVYDIPILVEQLEKENKEIERLKEELKYTVPVVEHNKTITKHIKEEERLHSIINELEKYINEEYIYDELGMKIFDASELQDKLQELKGSDKE